MEVQGSRNFPTSPQRTYELLTNPDVIVRAMPGMKSLTPKSKDLFDAEIVVGVAGIKGSYQGSVELKNAVPAHGYTLCVKGDGPMGFMESEVDIRLVETETGGTNVTYQGAAKVGGTVAGVGQRMLSGVAKLLIGQFFQGVIKQAKA